MGTTAQERKLRTLKFVSKAVDYPPPKKKKISPAKKKKRVPATPPKKVARKPKRG
jgi:hypothetical protein